MRLKVLVDFNATELERFTAGRSNGHTFYVTDWIKAMFNYPERVEIKEIRIVER